MTKQFPRHLTSKTARRRAIRRLERLNEQLNAIQKNFHRDVGYEPNFESAFGMIKEMRRIVRNADLTKTFRRRWSTGVQLIELMLFGLQADALKIQPLRIEAHLAELASIVSAVKAGNASTQEAQLVVVKTRSFLRLTQPSSVRDQGIERLKQLVEELKALQSARVMAKTFKQDQEK